MEAITGLGLVVYGVAAFFMAILSGIGGAGGGFIMTPLLIFMGLSPAQAVATGKFSGLALSLGSLGGLSEVKRGSKKQLYFIVGLAFVIGLFAPLAITRLDSEVYRQALGILLLCMVPVLIIKKVGRKEYKPSKAKQIAGYFLLTLSLCLQAVFSGGLGTLVNIVLMVFLGMSALEANVTKRTSQVVLNTVIVLGVLASGLVVWKLALVAVVASSAGGYIGAKIGVKRGDTFVMTVFIILMIVSALYLLLG